MTVDLGTPQPGLPQTQALVGIESDSNEVIQLPLFLNADQTSRRPRRIA